MLLLLLTAAAASKSKKPIFVVAFLHTAQDRRMSIIVSKQQALYPTFYLLLCICLLLLPAGKIFANGHYNSHTNQSYLRCVFGQSYYLSLYPRGRFALFAFVFLQSFELGLFGVCIVDNLYTRIRNKPELSVSNYE